MLALDYPPMQGGIARLLGDLVSNAGSLDEWRVVTSTPGPPCAGVIRAATITDVLTVTVRQSLWLRRGTRPLVVCGHPYAIGLAWCAARVAGAELGAIVYGKELAPRRWRHRITLRPLRQCRSVVAISRHSATLALRLGVRQKVLKVRTPSLAPAWQRARSAHLRATDEPLRLIAVGRMAEGYKNFELLLRLISVLAGSTTPVRLTIIGDGPRRSAIETKAEGLNVGGLVDFVGAVDDVQMAELLADAHVGLFPSRDSSAEGGFEGFGLVVHEMACAGLAVLVGSAGGAVDAAAAGWSLLLDPDDLRTWVQAVESLAQDEPRRFAMARAAAEWSRGVDPVSGARCLADALGE